VQGRCDILVLPGRSTAIDRSACLCKSIFAFAFEEARFWRHAFSSEAVVASHCGAGYYTASNSSGEVRTSIPEHKSTACTQLPLRPHSFDSSALPSASAIEVCARSVAEVSLLQACSVCPEGGTCAGKLSPPIAAKNWWGIDGDTLFTSCQIDVLNGRCLGSTNCSQVSTHAHTSQDEQEGGTAWFDGLEGRFALDCTLRPVLSCSYTRAVFASGATTGTTLGSGSASSAPMASPGPRKTR